MKQFFQTFLSVNRVERIGQALMAFVLVVLVVIRCTMNIWVKPAGPNEREQQRLATLYTSWKAGQQGTENQSGEGVLEPSASAATLFPFDPNTLDSNGFIRLGMPPNAVKGLLNWRRHGKHFYEPEDLKSLYNLPEANYAQLEPYIQIAAGEDRSFYKQKFETNRADIPAIIDLNTADSTLLDRGINGIGATLARKIVLRRAALGGFVKQEQLLEIYRFPDSTFQQIKAHLSINQTVVKRMKLNTATLAQMSAHPYIGEKLAKNIILFREGIKNYESIEQLRQAPLMTEEIYRKIAPYFTLD